MPSAQRNREEAVNTQLAVLISRLGVTAEAETIHVHGKFRPDVLFEMRGLRVIIEGKFADVPAGRDIVLEDARGRVRAGLAHIAVAAVYPPGLRATRTTDLVDELGRSQLDYRIVTEASESEWFSGTPAGLMDTLRRAQESLTEDDIVQTTAKSLSDRLDGVAKLWAGQKGACDRLSALLGIPIPKRESAEHASARRESASKVSALVLASALIFEEQLAMSDRRVTPLRRLSQASDLVSTVRDHWAWIWEHVDYVPIFQLGESILVELPMSTHSTTAVRAVLAEAQAICTQQSALRHDLMGRIYHWLLHNAKYLGTYYTATSSATLLLKLALSLTWSTDLADPKELSKFKVGDLACGTGTLLMAAAQAISDAYILGRAAQDRSLGERDLQLLHRTLMEDVLYGYDVLPSAVHLTASTLAMLAPEVAFVQMNLFVLPLGVDHSIPHLGSLDFLGQHEIRTQMALDYSQAEATRTGAATSYVTNATVPPLDLCVMNPPFVRSVYGNLLFGSLPDERGELQKELSKRAKSVGASATAGLGAVFVSLADSLVKPSGRIAFLLPVTLTSGEAWAATRRLIASHYHLEIVITSHDAAHPNFSENTNLSEVMFIARRLLPGEIPGQTTYFGLWRNPRSIPEALDLASRLEAGMAESDGLTPEGRFIRRGANTLAVVSTYPAPQGVDGWTPALIAQPPLVKAYLSLSHESSLTLPGERGGHHLPLCRLDELGVLGYDARDIFDAFAVDKTMAQWSPYPGFWDHSATKVRTIAQEPNSFLLAREKPLPGRPFKSAEAVWAKAGRILLVSRLRTNTQRLIAAGFPRAVLGNTWWGFDDAELSDAQRKALVLWLNSSLSVLLYYGRRAITEGAWMQMKKPAWASMPVLDVRGLSDATLDGLAAAYDRLADKELQPIAMLDTDRVRGEIDSTLTEALGTPGVAALRELLAREPGLTAHDSPNSETRAVDGP